MNPEPDPSAIFRLEQPDPALWKLYLLRSVLSGPAIIFSLPYLYFRYQTLRYRFDEEGVHMKVGILFRREVNLTYARIQDIHLRSGFIQRWLGLADVQVQTASGNAGAELVIEGFREFDNAEEVKLLIAARMRDHRDAGLGDQDDASHQVAGPSTTTGALEAVLAEARALRLAMEQRGETSAG